LLLSVDNIGGIKMDCIFCKLVAGEIPSTRVYEDEETLAFLDIAPIVEGHTLVIPKTHVDPLMAATDDTLAACIKTVKRVAQALIVALGADGVNIHQANGESAGQVVPHLHFHVIPRFKEDGHHWNWRGKAYNDMASMQAIGAKISGAIAPES
jgi:histidine triad (HIT) family protein